MKLFCSHRWEDESEHFNPPTQYSDGKIRGYSESVAIFFYGITTVKQRCIKCNKTKAYTVAGKTKENMVMA